MYIYIYIYIYRGGGRGGHMWRMSHLRRTNAATSCPVRKVVTMHVGKQTFGTLKVDIKNAVHRADTASLSQKICDMSSKPVGDFGNVMLKQIAADSCPGRPWHCHRTAR